MIHDLWRSDSSLNFVRQDASCYMFSLISRAHECCRPMFRSCLIVSCCFLWPSIFICGLLVFTLWDIIEEDKHFKTLIFLCQPLSGIWLSLERGFILETQKNYNFKDSTHYYLHLCEFSFGHLHALCRLANFNNDIIELK